MVESEAVGIAVALDDAPMANEIAENNERISVVEACPQV